jgi:hypothetical protein
MVDKLKIYGSYQDSLNNLKMIGGHNSTNYMIGGNVRYNIRNNIIDWELLKSTDINPAIKINQINSLFKFRKFISDPKELYYEISNILNLSNLEFGKMMERSLNLDEPIILQLRKLFYILNEYDYGDIFQIEFCKLEPIKRLNSLLTMLENTDIKVSSSVYEKIEKHFNNIKNMIEKKNNLFLHNFYTKSIKSIESIESIKNIENNKNIDDIIDIFIKKYEEWFDILEKVEKINVNIAFELEKISDLI